MLPVRRILKDSLTDLSTRLKHISPLTELHRPSLTHHVSGAASGRTPIPDFRLSSQIRNLVTPLFQFQIDLSRNRLARRSEHLQRKPNL